MTDIFWKRGALAGGIVQILFALLFVPSSGHAQAAEETELLKKLYADVCVSGELPPVMILKGYSKMQPNPTALPDTVESDDKTEGVFCATCAGGLHKSATDSEISEQILAKALSEKD